jgi:hypothetical protein
MRVLCATEATAHGGRDGHVRSSDGTLDLDLRVPVELGGGERATNPERSPPATQHASRAHCARWRGRAGCR